MIRWRHLAQLLQAVGSAAPFGAGTGALRLDGTEAAALVRLAVHEGGHAAAARALGLDYRRIEIDADLANARCLIGGIGAASPQQRRMVALAGGAAEHVAAHGAMRATSATMAEAMRRGTLLSRPDWALAGSVTGADVDAALQLVLVRWRVVARLAEFAAQDFVRDCHGALA